jgi:hypothetical protein
MSRAPRRMLARRHSCEGRPRPADPLIALRTHDRPECSVADREHLLPAGTRGDPRSHRVGLDPGANLRDCSRANGWRLHSRSCPARHYPSRRTDPRPDYAARLRFLRHTPRARGDRTRHRAATHDVELVAKRRAVPS